jgi:hypothetical protein
LAIFAPGDEDLVPFGTTEEIDVFLIHYEFGSWLPFLTLNELPILLLDQAIVSRIGHGTALDLISDWSLLLVVESQVHLVLNCLVEDRLELLRGQSRI